MISYSRPRTYYSSKFTISDIEANQKELQRVKKELTSQKKLCEATCKNIETNHKFVKALTDEQTHHVWMYQENKVVVDDSKAKLKEVDEQLKEYDEITKTIYEVGGFVASAVVTVDK